MAFGEKVHYKPAKSIRIEKVEARWSEGAWLGIIPETHENIIGTEKSVATCRAIAAVEESEKFDKKTVENMNGASMATSARRESK